MKTVYLIFYLFLSFSTYATHVAGGVITYAPTGNLNEYEFTLTVYRDCDAFANIGDTVQLSVSNSCGIINSPQIALAKISVEEISQICTAELANTSCGGTAALEGIEKQVFKGTSTLSGICSEWNLSYKSCNRNTSSNLQNSESKCFYIETKLNNANFPCNSSPIIVGQYQIPYTCAGQSINLSSFVIDKDGDSLSFSFINSLESGGSPIQYNAPFTAAQPIPGITISNTGEISFNYSITGSFVLTVLVEEFDDQGLLKGSIIHDFQVVIETCTNNIPFVTSISNFNNLGTTAYLNSDTIFVGFNDQFCFDVEFWDPDPNTALILSSDIQDILPGASVTTSSGNNPETITICGAYNPNFIGGFFSVSATDDACPIPGVNTKIFHLSLPTSLLPIPDTMIICGGNISTNLNCSTISESLEWKDNNGNLLIVGTDISCNPCLSPDLLFTTSRTISANLLSNPLITKDIFIDFYTVPSPFLTDTTFTCLNTDFQFTGPHGQYNETWMYDSIIFNQNQPTINTTDTTFLYYSDNASNVCFYEDSTLIYPTKPTATISGDYSGLSANTMNGYLWTFNNFLLLNETYQTHIPLGNGDYRVIGYNTYNCSDTSNVIAISILEIPSLEKEMQVVRTAEVVKVNAHENFTEIFVYNIQGKLILTQSVNTSTTIIQLPHAIQSYIIVATGKNGELLSVKKI
ncbi:MAG: hypothetical protein AB8B72_02370 [Crocinitomicaceae bacterium]